MEIKRCPLSLVHDFIGIQFWMDLFRRCYQQGQYTQLPNGPGWNTQTLMTQIIFDFILNETLKIEGKTDGNN